MRLFLACFLVACGNNPVDDIVPIDVDATIDHRTSGSDVLFPPAEEAGPDGPVYVGGPLKCGKGNCTCDGTLYACVFGFQGCAGNPPTEAGADADADADADAEADADASTGCTSNDFCKQIPTECLPKPTCECISKVLNLTCTIAPDGSGFLLQCP